MISPEQLAEALDRIHPRDRELLSLSLRRRVPDEALARLYEVESSDVARRRARAIERLADEMELKRGEDLGAVLKALLEPETWSAAATTLGEEFAVEAGGTHLTALPPPNDREIRASGPALAPVPMEPAPQGEDPPTEEAAPEEASAEAEAPAEVAPDEAEAPAPAEAAPVDAAAPVVAAAAPDTAAPAQPERAEDAPAEPGSPEEAAAPAAQAQPEPESQPQTETAPANGRAQTAGAPIAPPVPPPNEHVLEMLADREQEAPDPPRRAVPLALLGLSVASLVGAAGVVGATQFGETNRIIQPTGSGGGNDDTTRHFIPEQGGPLALPFPTDTRSVSCYSTAYVPQTTTLYRGEPGSRKRMRITPRTEWGSPRVLGVLKQRGGWLGVQAAELRNGEIGWVRREQAQIDCVRWSLHADLSRRMLFVRRDGHTVRKMTVAVGRPQNPTPKGRFTVTDKLRVTDRDSAYGCCVLALSGHQTHLPAYWPGGDRLAVHATTEESTIGKPVSLGCMRTGAARARWLIETVPLGAPIFIKA